MIINTPTIFQCVSVTSKDRQCFLPNIVNDSDSYSQMAFIDEIPVLFRVDQM